MSEEKQVLQSERDGQPITNQLRIPVTKFVGCFFLLSKICIHYLLSVDIISTIISLKCTNQHTTTCSERANKKKLKLCCPCRKVGRVLTFSPLVGIGTPPPPIRRRVCPPTLRFRGGHSLAREGLGSPNSDERTYTVVLCIYSSLWGSENFQAKTTFRLISEIL